MLDRACAAKVVIYGHVSKTKGKPFQYGRSHYEVRLKSRFPAHRVHHSESIIAVVTFSLRSLSKTDLLKQTSHFIVMTCRCYDNPNYRTPFVTHEFFLGGGGGGGGNFKNGITSPS